MKALGDLMSKLGQGGGGGGGGGGQPPGSTGTCLSGRYQTGDVSKVSDPCAQYVPNISDQIGTTTPGGCDPLSQSLGLCGNSNPPSNQTGDALTVNPTRGVPPLNVTATFSSGLACSDAFDLSWGDGSTDQTMQYAPPTDGSACTQIGKSNSFTHTFTDVGTYTVTLLSGTSLQFTSTVNVTVSISAATSTGTTTSQTSYPILNSTSTSSYGGIFQGQVPPGGYRGNIFFNGNGATVVSGSRDVNGNSEVAGFYGGETFGAPQSLASQWCQSRPWATNFLSHIVPPSFLDGVCQTFGYQVGASQPTLTQTTSQSGRQQGQTSSSKENNPAPTQQQSTTTSAINAAATIWAVPPSVPLGSRTSIFWTSRGVQTCTETSPDGSFNQTTLSGGAATVPLTGDTTFSISCLTGDGTPVTGYTTVHIKI